MSGFEDSIIMWLTEAAHHPEYLYFVIIVILTLSSFGLPVPEEVVLITAGFTANIALQEAVVNGTDPTINHWTLASVCFFAVFLSDSLVFFLGRRFGMPLLSKKPFSNFINAEVNQKIQRWTQKYGALACAIFRFTPALRFPGHFMCGALKISYVKFILTDGVAALLTVPTQVLLIANYGDEILVYIKQFKIFLLVLIILALCIWLFLRLPKTKADSAA